LFPINRLLWTVIPLLLYGLTVRLFSFRVPAKQKRKEDTAPEVTPAAPAYHTVKSTHPGFARELTVFLSQTRIYVSAVIKSYPFLALVIIWSMLIGVNLFDFLRRGTMLVHFYPFTGVLLPGIHLPIIIFGGLIVIFYSAELAHFERGCSMNELTDASPGSNGMFWASKLASLAVIVTGLTLYSLLMVLGIQAAFGFFDGSPAIVTAFLISTCMPLTLVGLLGLFFQALVPNKYVAMVLLCRHVLRAHTAPSVGGFGTPTATLRLHSRLYAFANGRCWLPRRYARLAPALPCLHGRVAGDGHTAFVPPRAGEAPAVVQTPRGFCSGLSPGQRRGRYGHLLPHQHQGFLPVAVSAFRPERAL
jgi:hypothetical protein